MRRGFSLLEVVVVITLFVVVVGVAYYKFSSDRRQEMRQASKVDKQQSMRRFLMWFRQDMQSMDSLKRFMVVNSFDPLMDSRLIEIALDRFASESSKEEVIYRFDFNQRQLTRVSGSGQSLKIDNIVNVQLMPYDFAKQRILNTSELGNLWYFDAKILFSDTLLNSEAPGTVSAAQEFWLRIYPKLKSAQNKAGFNQFQLNQRF